MSTSADRLRELAADCRAQARAATPQRALQLRECAGTFSRQALRMQLFEHSNEVGRGNVTPASFRAYLRATRA